MRIGVISDIHGNKVVLKAVLTAMPSVDRIVYAGDIVGYNLYVIRRVLIESSSYQSQR